MKAFGSVATVAAAVGVLAIAVPAAHACCPSGGSGSPSAIKSIGLGESAPAASNQSMDPEWRVYEFAKDGIRYLQINDSVGTVRAGIGSVSGLAWVMPMGVDAGRVVVRARSTEGVPVYSSEIGVVRVIKGAKGVSKWIVVPANND